MQPFRFNFNGDHELLLPDGECAFDCARDIVEGKAYPFPAGPGALRPRVVVDVGAHVGEFTIMAALLWPEATIHAYEPYPPVAEVLRHNLQKFTNVVIHEAAVGWTDGPAVLHLSDDGTLCHSLYREQLAHPTDQTVPVERVHPAVIGQLKPDVLKLDCEGGEPLILQFLSEEIPSIGRIYAEFHSERDRRQMFALLEKTHSLGHCRMFRPEQGEVMWFRR